MTASGISREAFFAVLVHCDFDVHRVAGNLSTSQQGIRLILRKFGFHGATLRTLEHLQIEYEVQKLRAQIPELADGRSRDCHF